MPAPSYSQRVAVVTGAGAGIGRALAVALARRGTQLTLWDINGEGLARTADLCRDPSQKPVRIAEVDVTDARSLTAHANAVRETFGAVNMAFCLAGVIHTGSVLTSRPADLDHVLTVNLHGTVNTVTAVLPHLVASGEGYLVTTSSAFGLVAVPRYGAYCASKSAILAFTDAVRLELRAARAPVRVSCVIPGGVRTDILRNGRYADDENPETVAAHFDTLLARTTPDQAADTILRGVDRGRRRILVGTDARAVAGMVRLTGAGYQHLLPRLLRDGLRHTTPSKL